tara:strand:+ start:1219 stop:1584 length:366 start_codon:yes stop_codon:yes gene_type:complete
VKNWVVIFALLLFLRPGFPYLEYALDYEYISTVLCENKDKPKLECNGKCYLMKALAEASEKESNQKKKSNTATIELLPLVNWTTEQPVVYNFEETTIKTFPTFRTSGGRQHLQSLFRPPII